jgi:hypothetical protein
MDGAALIIVISGGVFGAVARSVPPGEQDAPTRTVRNAPMRIEGRASARNEWEIPAESQREPTRDRRTIRPIVVCGLSCRGGESVPVVGRFDVVYARNTSAGRAGGS